MKVGLSDFVAAMVMMNTVIERRNTIPILSMVRLVSNGGELHVIGNDLDMMLTARVAATGGALDVCVNARRLLAFLRTLRGEDVEIEEAKTERRLVVSGDGAKARFVTLASDDYPMLDPGGFGVLHEFDPGVLASDLKFTALAMSTEDVRYYLNGVCVHGGGGAWTMVATDGHRLHRVVIPNRPLPPVADEQEKLIIPRKTAGVMLALLGRCGDANRATLEFGRAKMGFTVGRYRLLSKMIDGQFPDYSRVIPTERNAGISAAADDVLRAVRQASAISNKNTSAMKFAAKGGGLVVEVKCIEEGDAAAVVAGASVSDLTFEVGFNASYMRTLASAFSKATLVGSLVDHSSPSLWTSPEAPFRTVVLMPMRV